MAAHARTSGNATFSVQYNIQNSERLLKIHKNTEQLTDSLIQNKIILYETVCD